MERNVGFDLSKPPAAENNDAARSSNETRTARTPSVSHTSSLESRMRTICLHIIYVNAALVGFVKASCSWTLSIALCLHPHGALQVHADWLDEVPLNPCRQDEPVSTSARRTKQHRSYIAHGLVEFVTLDESSYWFAPLSLRPPTSCNYV
jgi:hypothetical protein